MHKCDVYETLFGGMTCGAPASRVLITDVPDGTSECGECADRNHEVMLVCEKHYQKIAGLQSHGWPVILAFDIGDDKWNAK